MKERILTSLLTAFIVSGLQAQNAPAVPRLVIGLTVDQLRMDYIEAFFSLYGERGFKRLWKEGRVYCNAEYDFVDVEQASAVASVYTGTTPFYNGVVGNYWMDRASLRIIKSADDADYMGIYTQESSSPKYLQVSTLSDELTIASGGMAEVYSIAPTREMAVYSGGHAAKGVFWLNDETGKWCGTTYYGSFPEWVTTYNDHKGLDFRIDNQAWEPYLPVTSYKYLTSDAKQLTFKHDFTDERSSKYKRFKTSPFVNDEVNRLVSECFDKTSIGKDAVPDLLTLSYYAGNYAHKSDGEYTMEIQDVYVRLDNTIGDLLDLVERKVGLHNVLFFITSTGYSEPDTRDLSAYRIPGGKFYMKRCAALLNMYLMAVYGQGQYVETFYDRQLFFNHKLIEDKKINLTEILNNSADFIVQMSGVQAAYTSQRLLLGAWAPKIDKIKNSFNVAHSGDIYVEVMPGWTLVDEYTQTSHLVREAYSSVPLVFIGNNIRPEIIYTPVKVTTIAPTIAHFMRIRAPNASEQSPLYGICN